MVSSLMTSYRARSLGRRRLLAAWVVTAAISGGCSAQDSSDATSSVTVADPSSNTESTILLIDELVFDGVRSLINESFVTLLASVEPGDASGTIARVRVEQVLSNLTPYVDTMSVTAPAPGDVVDIEFFNAQYVPAAGTPRVLLFASYGRGQWYVMGGLHGVYTVAGTLSGAPGSVLDGMDAVSTLDQIRTQGDEQEQVMANARAQEAVVTSLATAAGVPAVFQTRVSTDRSAGRVLILIWNVSTSTVETPLFVEVQVRRDEQWDTIGFVPFVGETGVASLCPALDSCEAAPLSEPLAPGDETVRNAEATELPAGPYRAVVVGTDPDQQIFIEEDS